MNDSSFNLQFPDLQRHPAAWRGPELERRPDWRRPWTAEELREIAAAAPRLAAGPSAEPQGCFPPDSAVARRMRSVQQQLEHGCGGAWIEGLPADDYTPQQLEGIFWELTALVGTPLSQTADGQRLFHVRDEGYGDKDARARGPNTAKRLSFHTDRCDVIAFLCLQPAQEGGENEIVSSVALFNDIAASRPDLLQVLMTPYLYQRHNIDRGNPQPYTEQPIFTVHEGHFAANLLRVLIERAYAADETPAMSQVQREALDYLEELAESPGRRLRFRQQRGDLLLLNNFVTLHRRSAFVDHEDPRLRRHLLRIWLSVPNSRPLDPRFAGNYGAVAAGALRGGIHGGGSRVNARSDHE